MESNDERYEAFTPMNTRRWHARKYLKNTFAAGELENWPLNIKNTGIKRLQTGN